jgi:hypothetical protein
VQIVLIFAAEGLLEVGGRRFVGVFGLLFEEGEVSIGFEESVEEGAETESS